MGHLQRRFLSSSFLIRVDFVTKPEITSALNKFRLMHLHLFIFHTFHDDYISSLLFFLP